MHIKVNKNIFNRIIAMFICIVLLSNFGLNIAWATEISSTRVGYLQFGDADGKPPNTTIKDNKMIATYDEYPNGNAYGITIVPTETAIYTVTVSDGTSELEYALYSFDDKLQLEETRLAARYGANQYSLITSASSEKSTTIDIILEKDKTYYWNIDDIIDKPVTITASKRNISSLAMAGSNIPSSVISSKEPYKKSTKLEQYTDTGIKLVEFTENEINKYISYGFTDEGEADKGGPLEAILVDLIMVISTIFITIVEWLVNANVRLTIDNIIFNRLDQTTIDLTPLGGVQVGTDLPSSGKGIFHNSNVGEVINVLYNGLKNLTIAIYLVMLLYVGIKILLSIGTSDQKKYFKYLEYWITGMVFLVLIPYFLPAIPAMSNSLVALMEEKAQSINGDYSTTEVLAKLGNDASLLGEDAEAVEIQNIIDEKIEKLNNQLTNSPQTREDAQDKINAEIQTAVKNFGFDQVEAQQLENKINVEINIIDQNYDNWTDTVEEEYQNAIDDVRDYIYKNANINKSIEDVFNNLPPEITRNYSARVKILDIMRYIQRNAHNWNEYQSGYNVKMIELRDLLAKPQYNFNIDAYSVCQNIIEAEKREYTSYASGSNAMQGLERLFANYKAAVIQEEIELLEDMRDKIGKDVMTTLKTKAQKENRFVYAIAWMILLYQMFAVLFMYYKRVFVLVMLIIIFPVVMAFYVFDKLGDGKAQSLESWLKEFLANILVQILHAAIYIIIINIGIDACNSDPSRNWFFLILAVCFLFPGERLLRSILNLEASTLVGLRNNVDGLVIGGVVAAKTAKNVVKSAKNASPKEIKKKLQKEVNESEERKKAKNAAKKRMQERQAAIRKYRQESILDGTANKFDKIHERASRIKDGMKAKINGFKLVQGTKETVSSVKSSKVYKHSKTAIKYGKFAVKKGLQYGKKGVSMTLGASEGMETFSEKGFLAGANQASIMSKSYNDILGTSAKKSKMPKPSASQVKPNVNNNQQNTNGSELNYEYINNIVQNNPQNPQGGGGLQNPSNNNQNPDPTLNININTQVNDNTQN